MASLHLNQLRGTSVMKSTGEAIPRQSARAVLGNGSLRQAAPSQSMTDFRTGENFNHLKLTAEKMMQEQASVKSDLQILKIKLKKSEDQVRTLESKVQDMNNENAMLKVKHKQDMKLWNGLDSKFLSTTTFCDQLAETLQLLECQVQEADRSKAYLEDKLAERLKFFEFTECRLNDLLEKKEGAEDSMTQCEASNVKLQCTIREMELKIVSDSIKFEKVTVEKDCLQQELTTAIKTNEDKEAIVRSTRCEIQDLQNEITFKAKEATDLQHLNLALMNDKGELELEMRGQQSSAATLLKDNEALQQELEMFKVKITDLEKVNASAAVNIENLLADKAKFNQQIEEDKIAQGRVVTELKQCRVEHKMDVEVIKQQLQEAIKENERLVAVVGEKESKFASLQDETNRLRQEHTENSQLILGISQNAQSLRRENAMMQEQLTAAEDLAKSFEVKFNLQIGVQQEASRKHLDDISQRYNQEIADTRRKSEAEIKEAVAKERLKGEDALKAVKQASDEGMAKELEAFDKRWQSVQGDCERRISNLREGYEEERMKIAAVHADQIHKIHEQSLDRVNETISKLREGHEEEKKKIALIYSDEINKKEGELHKVKETMSKLREGYEEGKSKIVSIHSNKIHKMEEEYHKVKETMSKLEEGYEEEKSKIVSIHSNKIHKMEEEYHKVKETMSKLREGYEEEKLKIVSIHSNKIHKMEEEYHKVKETVGKLREGHEEEKTKIISIHSNEIRKMEEELDKVKETISKLRDCHEQDKTKIVAIHAQDIHKMQEELRRGKETRDVSITELRQLQRKIDEIGQFNREEMKELHREYQSQLQKITEEKFKLHEAMKEMQVAHEELLIREKQEQKTQFDKLEKDQKVQSHDMQNSLNQEINEWRSKTFGLEIQLKEALQQIATKEALKEDNPIQIVNEDFKMTITEELISKDIPTPIVTPITKNKEPQQPNQRLTAMRIIHLEDTTDEDAEEDRQKQAPQPGKDHIQRSSRPGKRKTVDVSSPPEEAPGVNGGTLRRKGTLNIHHKKAMHQASTDSTKATEDGSSGNKMTSMRNDNEPQQQQLILRQQSVEESRRETGFTCTQRADLHPMPGPTYQKGFGHEVLDLSSQGKNTAPKRRVRKSTKDVSQERKQFTKALSPAINDLFQVDGLVPYYKGDDPYAFD